jgi:imidazolonepropionase-like amidohydrolase
MPVTHSIKVLRSRRLIDGMGGRPIDYPIIVVEGNLILDAGPEGQVDVPRGPDVQQIDLGDSTVLPGLIDSHVHLALGTRGRYEEMMGETDGVHLMTGVANARDALNSGITSVKDAGARNRVAHDLREGWRLDLIQAPRLFISGRPLTVPGGHFHFCNDNEARGVNQVRARVRQFVQEGVDLIKIMASGGGTRGTSNKEASFSVEELRAAVEEAHSLNRTTMAHCEAFESVGNAARAGVNVLEHCGFIMPDGSRAFDEEAVEVIVEKGLYYDPTLQTGSGLMDALRERRDQGERLSKQEEASLEAAEYKIRTKSENLMRMVGMGVNVVAGSDGIGLGNSTRLIRAMELMVEAGMKPVEVITAATTNAARALKVWGRIGAIRKGLEADIIAVGGDPTDDMGHLRELEMVMQGGKILAQSMNA